MIDATDVAAWTGLALGATALALVWRWRPHTARPNVEVALASARHGRAGLDSSVTVVLEVRNEGTGAARLVAVEAEVAALTNGEVGLRTQRRTARVPLSAVVPARSRSRVPATFAFEDALLPDGKVDVRVRLVHEDGIAEAAGSSVK